MCWRRQFLSVGMSKPTIMSRLDVIIRALTSFCHVYIDVFGGLVSVPNHADLVTVVEILKSCCLHFCPLIRNRLQGIESFRKVEDKQQTPKAV